MIVLAVSTTDLPQKSHTHTNFLNNKDFHSQHTLSFNNIARPNLQLHKGDKNRLKRQQNPIIYNAEWKSMKYFDDYIPVLDTATQKSQE
jgi:hypothetical protein